MIKDVLKEMVERICTYFCIHSKDFFYQASCNSVIVRIINSYFLFYILRYTDPPPHTCSIQLTFMYSFFIEILLFYKEYNKRFLSLELTDHFYLRNRSLSSRAMLCDYTRYGVYMCCNIITKPLVLSD